MFVCMHVRQALQQVAAIGACSPYFAAAEVIRPCHSVFMRSILLPQRNVIDERLHLRVDVSDPRRVRACQQRYDRRAARALAPTDVSSLRAKERIRRRSHSSVRSGLPLLGFGSRFARR